MDGLIDACLRGLTNTVNLQACTWTRDGSLSSDILLAILDHPSLQELEINGRHYGSYDHTILPRFTGVRRIKLIMPSPPVIEVLSTWLKCLTDPLQSLSIVCKVGGSICAHANPAAKPRPRQSSSAVTDSFLQRISEDLSGLDELHLTGCQRVTHEGLSAALLCNKNGIKKLGIESVSSLLVRCNRYPQNRT